MMLTLYIPSCNICKQWVEITFLPLFGEESFFLCWAAPCFSSTGYYFAHYSVAERHGGHNFPLHSNTIHCEKSGSSTCSKSTVTSFLKKGEKGSRDMKIKTVFLPLAQVLDPLAPVYFPIRLFWFIFSSVIMQFSCVLYFEFCIWGY